MNRRNFVLLFTLLLILPVGIVAALIIRDRENSVLYEDVDTKSLGVIDLNQHNATIQDIPQNIRSLEGHRVRLLGDMWQPIANGAGKLAAFSLVASRNGPSYNPSPPVAQQFISAQVMAGTVLYYFDEPVAVDGIFHIRITKNGGILKSVYAIDAERVTPVSQLPVPPVGKSLHDEAIVLACCSAGIFLVWVVISLLLKKRAPQNPPTPLPRQP